MVRAADVIEKPAGRQLVHAPGRWLAARSVALVARGLRDLARDSNWLVKKVFTGFSPHLAISPAGQVCAVSPQVRHGTERVALYDIERSVPTMALSIPNEPSVCPPDAPAVFAWSPAARYLVAAWGAWPRELHVFDLHAKMLLGGFGEFANFPNCLAWPESGKYFAAAFGGKRRSLRVWQAQQAVMPLAGEPVGERGAPEWIERQTYEVESGDEGAFAGYGRTAFSPDEKALATVAEIHGDWADDSILLLNAPSLEKRGSFQAQGHITSLAWTPDGRHIIHCAAGQAYRLAVRSLEAEPLPFGAELCACHPHLPVCLCFSSWLKNSAMGRLFLVDLNRQTVFDEYAAEGVADMCWSADGARAYAITREGLAYIYESPLM